MFTNWKKHSVSWTASTNDISAITTMMSSVQHSESRRMTAHALRSFTVRNPDSCMLTYWTLAVWKQWLTMMHTWFTYKTRTFDDFLDTTINMEHPFLLFHLGGSIYSEWFSSRHDLPRMLDIWNNYHKSYSYIKQLTSVIFNVLKLDLFQGNDSLFMISLLGNQDRSINKQIIEQEELTWFWLLSTGLHQDSFANKSSSLGP